MTDRKLSKISELMLKQSNIFSRKNSLLNKTSNRTDFDYLRLRDEENIRMFRPVQAILDAHGESRIMAVFSEIIQNYDTNLNGTEMIIMITRKSIFILVSRCNLKMRYELASLADVILIKANPSFFALSFRDKKPPLVLECFRRSELSIFALSLREHQEPKPRVITSDTIQMTTRNGEK